MSNAYLKYQELNHDLMHRCIFSCLLLKPQSYLHYVLCLNLNVKAFYNFFCLIGWTLFTATTVVIKLAKETFSFEY